MAETFAMRAHSAVKDLQTAGEQAVKRSPASV
jgi:hypothetical protein